MLSINKSLALVLMFFSMVLLIVLQALWIGASWRQAREDFRKETNLLFRNTIFALQDSMMARNIRPVSGDTLFRQSPIVSGDSVYTFHPDSIIEHARMRPPTSVVEVFITHDNGDSLRNVVAPLARRLRMDKRNRKFIVHLGPDSLNTDTIKAHFREALVTSGIEVPFSVYRIRKEMSERLHPVRFQGRRLVSEAVPFNPVNYYAAEFVGYNRFFLAAITPQILFCLFVTLLTGSSFYAMNRSINSQKKLMEMKNEFIANMSHELKTPVSTVSVAIEALEKFNAFEDVEKRNEYLTMAKSELQRLALMTDKILQTASLGSQGARAVRRVVDLDKTVLDVLDSFRLLFAKRGIKPLYTKSGDDFHLRSNAEHMATLVYNLIDNAIKYTKGSSSIKVTVQHIGDELMLSVEDDGIGIPGQYHKRIFERFFRVPSGDVHDIKGYGLGLSYVASVVQDLKGTIKVESAPGEGTRFTIRFPKHTT